MINVSEVKSKLLPLADPERQQFFTRLKSYIYLYCEIKENNNRIPIYIGKGTTDRCFDHLSELNSPKSTKDEVIKGLVEKDILGIDILAYGLDSPTALAIESVCIDLLGLDNLTNSKRGHGKAFKRLSLRELSSSLNPRDAVCGQ